MRLTLIHEIDAGLIESAVKQLNDVEAIKNDLGVEDNGETSVIGNETMRGNDES